MQKGKLLLRPYRDLFKKNLGAVRKAHRVTMKNQKIYIFEKARKFINEQVELIMKSINMEFQNLIDQYYNLRAFAVNLERKLSKNWDLVKTQELMIFHLRLYIVKLIQRHGINTKKRKRKDMKFDKTDSDFGKYVDRATRSLPFKQFSFYNASIKLNSIDKQYVCKQEVVMHLENERERIMGDITNMLFEVHNARDIWLR
jgi:hypothetical protein